MAANAKPRLSLVMIVRDAEADLPHCLGSVEGVVDEIIVGDTGSKDGTKEVAARAGVQVLEIEWEDHFANARNQALEKATGDWVLVLDADEVLHSEHREKVLELITDPDAEAFEVSLINYVDNPEITGWRPVPEGIDQAGGHSGYVSISLVRLFRSNPQYKYEGRIHETVDHSIRNAGGKIQPSGVWIHHFGKARAENAKPKREYYLKLARLNAEELPRDPKAQCDLGDLLIESGQDDEAFRTFSRALELDPENVRAMNALAGVALRREDYDEARKWLERLENAGPELSRPARVNLGILAMRDGDYTKAQQILTDVLAADPGSAVAHFYLGVLSERQGNWEDAAHHFASALRLAPRHLPFQARQLASANVSQGARELAQDRSSEALRCLKVALQADPRHELGYFFIADVLERLNYKEEAERNRARARRLAPDLFENSG